MAKDDFDMDFHFDDDDFDPKAFLDGEDGADIDPRITPIFMTSRRMKTTTRMRKSRTSLPAAGRKSLKRPPNRPVSASQRSRRKRSPTPSPSCMTFTLLP